MNWYEIRRQAREQVAQQGPRRVLVSADGRAVNPERAAREYGIRPEGVYVRKDGGTLGTTRELEKVAEALWAGDWIDVMAVN